jgi:hypothetical protein
MDIRKLAGMMGNIEGRGERLWGGAIERDFADNEMRERLAALDQESLRKAWGYLGGLNEAAGTIGSTAWRLGRPFAAWSAGGAAAGGVAGSLQDNRWNSGNIWSGMKMGAGLGLAAGGAYRTQGYFRNLMAMGVSGKHLPGLAANEAINGFSAFHSAIGQAWQRGNKIGRGALDNFNTGMLNGWVG